MHRVLIKPLWNLSSFFTQVDKKKHHNVIFLHHAFKA